MPTYVESLNIKYGAKLFAEKVDEYGLPVDGWALPTLTINLEGTELRLTMGTFCLSPTPSDAPALEKCSVCLTLKSADCPEGKQVEDLRHQLLDMLVLELNKRS